MKENKTDKGEEQKSRTQEQIRHDLKQGGINLNQSKELTSKIILHVDLDYFFAQIEEREHPEYQDKPVVICVYSGRTEDSGAVSTANYIARKFGVKSGMPIAWAKHILKENQAIFLPVNLEKYHIISDDIMGLLRTYGDRFEQVSIDEAYIDVTNRVGEDYVIAENLVKRIKHEIQKQVDLTCSIGLGPNKLIAKIAANHMKPNGLTIVPPEKVKEFLRPLPVGSLFGVGRKTEKIMVEKGIKTLGDLADHPVDDLIHIFGKTIGLHFHEGANGIDASEVQEKGLPKSLSRIATLKIDTREPEALLQVLNRLCEDIAQKAKTKGLAYRTISLIVVAEDMSVHSKTLKIGEVKIGVSALVKAVHQLLEDYLRKSTINLRRIGVRISSLSTIVEQKNLNAYMV